jgi:hypothetical protein
MLRVAGFIELLPPAARRRSWPTMSVRGGAPVNLATRRCHTDSWENHLTTDAVALILAVVVTAAS